MVTNSTGTYCMQSGIEIFGPQLVAHDFSSAGNMCEHKMNKRAVTRRRLASITKRMKVALSLKQFTEWFTLMYSFSSPMRHELYIDSRKKIGRRIRIGHEQMTMRKIMIKSRCGNHVSAGIRDQNTVSKMATLIRDIAVKISTPKKTYASCRIFTVVFVSTIMDILSRGLKSIDGHILFPKLNLAINHRLPPDSFKRFGISCRDLSKAMRNIKQTISLERNPNWVAQLIELDHES